jgi:hypothetical protein
MKKAAKWMSQNGYCQGEIIQHAGGGKYHLVPLDKALEEYASQIDDAKDRYNNALDYLKAGKMGWKSRLQKAFSIASGHTPPAKTNHNK